MLPMHSQEETRRQGQPDGADSIVAETGPRFALKIRVGSAAANGCVVAAAQQFHPGFRCRSKEQTTNSKEAMMQKAAIAAIGLLMSVSATRATDITLYFINSGVPIAKLTIQDTICNTTRYDDYLATNDAKRVDNFCVLDASKLATDIKIYHDGVEKYILPNIPADSNIDVYTGKVNSP